jgi:hypothetical protein
MTKKIALALAALITLAPAAHAADGAASGYTSRRGSSSIYLLPEAWTTDGWKMLS